MTDDAEDIRMEIEARYELATDQLRAPKPTLSGTNTFHLKGKRPPHGYEYATDPAKGIPLDRSKLPLSLGTGNAIVNASYLNEARPACHRRLTGTADIKTRKEKNGNIMAPL